MATVVSKTNHCIIQFRVSLYFVGSASARQIAAPDILLLSHIVDEETEDEEER